MSDLLELAARVEALAGPDWIIDAQIDLAHRPECGEEDAPPYTDSIDIAMTLVPSGLVCNFGNDTAFCWAHIWDDTPDYNGEPYEGHASTLPCAILAAALRAQAREEG